MDNDIRKEFESQPGPRYPTDIRYITCIDSDGRLREKTMAAIWKLNSDGTLERVKYSEDIPTGDSKDDQR